MKIKIYVTIDKNKKSNIYIQSDLFKSNYLFEKNESELIIEEVDLFKKEIVGCKDYEIIIKDMR